MPSHTRVQEMISLVERGEFLEAMREFYHDEVAMQENGEPPRLGLPASLKHEEQFLAMVEKFHEIRAVSFLVDGDRAAIRWNFDVALVSGQRVKRDEVAYQRWEGDRIVCERFFYDPTPPAA